MFKVGLVDLACFNLSVWLDMTYGQNGENSKSKSTQVNK